MVLPATANTKTALEAARANLRALEERITTGRDRLAALRAEANAIVAQMNQVESTIALIQQESERVRRAMAKTRTRVWVHQRQLDERVREMFQTGGAPELSVLLDFTSLYDLSTRVEIIERATESDRDVIERAEALAARLKHRRDHLDELARAHSAERSDLRIQAARLQQRFEGQAIVIRQLDVDRQAAEELIGELDAKRKREIQKARQLARAATQAIVGSSRPVTQQATASLPRLLRPEDQGGVIAESTPQTQAEPTPEPTPQTQAEPTPEPSAKSTPQVQPEPTAEPTLEPTPQLETEPTTQPTPQAQTKPTDEPTAKPQTKRTASSRSAGTVFHVCPVDQPRAYTDDFGAPRSGGRTHQGNDIFAPHGTPIRAPFPGTASQASNGLGGIAVKVYGEKGYVYNAHLSRIGTLGNVSAGTIIGYVGNTGNARGTSPHNHFEWHPGNGSAVSPYSYLNEVC
ncbi:MAG TPA: peptidoglycan DD-metalloendopeptidase family protein [Actinomycetota bacterium]|nr:peptidoglycan DD-metalloendopeptidase family protein [Actinomycetota bacterium]